MYCGKPLELPESAKPAGDDSAGGTGIDFDLGGSL
jgi:hypothetical protein